MGFGLLVSVVAEGSVLQGLIQLSVLLRCSQFRLQCVKSFCREVLLWVWDILWSVKSFGFLLRHDETICEFLYFHLCAVTHAQRPAIVEGLPILVWDLVPSPLGRSSGGCKILSVLSSSGEKWHFVGLPKPGVLPCKMPVPFLCCKSFCAQAKQQDCPTPRIQRWTLLRWQSAVCTVLILAWEVCWIKRWKQTKSSLEMPWVTIVCGGFIHRWVVLYVGSECWLTMPQLLSQPTRWSCVGPLWHNKEEGCSISCLSLHWKWLQSVKAWLSEKAYRSQCEGVKRHNCLK